MGTKILNGDAHQAKPIDVLLVEDNEDDIELTTIAFNEAKIKNRLFVVKNGQEALDYLQRKDPYRDKEKFPTPKLLLVDINMPKMGGFELLEHMKKDDKLKILPVVMLTSSKNEEDIVKSYKGGAAAYLPKPISHEDFVKVINGFNLFWQLVELPPAG